MNSSVDSAMGAPPAKGQSQRAEGTHVILQRGVSRVSHALDMELSSAHVDCVVLVVHLFRDVCTYLAQHPET